MRPDAAGAGGARGVVFFDRDGTLIEDEHYLADPARVRLVPGAAAAVRAVRAVGLAAVVVTNQSGIGRRLFGHAEYEAVRARLDELLAAEGARLDATYYCPHAPEAACNCRKPAPGLFQRAADELGLDLARSGGVGDRERDVTPVVALGGVGVLVPSPGTPAAEVARAADGVIAPTLGEAVARLLDALSPGLPRRARVGVLASGGGSNLGALLSYSDALDARGSARAFDVVLVASDRAGAGALRRAGERGIGARHVTDPADGAALLGALDEHGVDLVVLAGYLKHVPEAVTRAFAGRMLNVHPSLLPAFGGAGMYGARVHRAVLAAGARVSGATVHFVDEAYDRGPIVAQWPVPVRADDTAESLGARVLRAEHLLLPRAVEAAAAGRVALGADGRVRGGLDVADAPFGAPAGADEVADALDRAFGAGGAPHA